MLSFPTVREFRSKSGSCEGTSPGARRLAASWPLVVRDGGRDDSTILGRGARGLLMETDFINDVSRVHSWLI